MDKHNYFDSKHNKVSRFVRQNETNINNILGLTHIADLIAKVTKNSTKEKKLPQSCEIICMSDPTQKETWGTKRKHPKEFNYAHSQEIKRLNWNQNKTTTSSKKVLFPELTKFDTPKKLAFDNSNSYQQEINNLEEYFQDIEEDIFTQINKSVTMLAKTKSTASINEVISADEVDTIVQNNYSDDEVDMVEVTKSTNNYLAINNFSDDMVEYTKPLVTYNKNAKCIQNTYKIMKNSLYDDPGMYEIPDRENIFVVGRYTLQKSKKSNIFYKSFMFNELQRKNINTTSQLRWLSDDTLDLASKIMTRNTNSYYIQHFSATLIFTCETLEELNMGKDFFLDTKKLEKYSYIFAILNIGAHWILIVVDVKNETFYYMDPNKTECSSKKFFNRWIDFTKYYDEIYGTFELSLINWKFKTLYINDIPKQKDGINCGVLCLMHIDYLINFHKRSDSDRFKCPEVYRHYIKTMLLRTSDKMLEFCIKCGENKYFKEYSNSDDTQLIECYICKRWVHFGCYFSYTTGETYPFSHWQKETTKFQCFLNHKNLNK